MKRSEFLKLSCAGCLLGATGLLTISSLSACSAPKGLAVYKAPVTDRKMSVPLAQLANKDITIVRGNGMEFDVAIHRKTDGSYDALLLRCTHFSNPLITTADSYTCKQHGSVFDLSGKAKTGPASQPLKQLKCAVAGDQLVVNV